MNRLILLLAFAACDSHVFTTAEMVDGEAGQAGSVGFHPKGTTIGVPSANQDILGQGGTTEVGTSSMQDTEAGSNKAEAGAPNAQGGTTEAGAPNAQGGTTEAGAPNAQGGTIEAGAPSAQTTIPASGSPSTGQAGTTSGNATAGAAGLPATPKGCLVELKAGCVACDGVDVAFLAECLGLVDCWRVNGCGPQDICSKTPKICSGRGIEALIGANAMFECACTQGGGL